MTARRIPGVVTGIVKSEPDAQGRVEVEFPWLGTDHQRPRAPIATPMTGGRRGLYFMPEVDDEVLVAFEQGDFAHPFVVGFLWNGVDATPETDHQNRVVVTPGGHTLRFEDGGGKVILRSAGGHTIELDDSGHIKLVASGGGNEIVIQKSGTTTVKASGQVTVEAPQIALTEGASQSLVFGEALVAHLNAMAAAFAGHTHGASPPAFPPAIPATLTSSRVKTG